MNPDPAEGPIAAAVPDRRSSAWDIRNAPKNYLSLALYQVASALFSFATVWLLTRTIGSDGYGGVVAVIAASQVAQVLVNWSSSAVVRFGVEEFIDTGEIARAFWTRFAILFLNLLVVLATAQLWFGPLAGWLKLTPGSFTLVMAHFVVTAIWVHVQMSLQGAKLQRMQGLLQMFERIAIFAGVIVLILSARLEFTSVVTCYIAAPAITAAVGIVVLSKLIFHSFALDGTFVKKLLAYSLPLLPFSLIGYFSGSYVDAVFIANFLSLRDLGIYAVATQINGMALQFPTLAATLLVPFFVSLDKEGDETKLRSYFTNALPNLTITCGVIAGAAALAAYFLIPAVFGTEFSAAAVPFWILIASTVAAIPVLCGYAPLTHARAVTYVAAIVSIVSAAVNIGLNFVLIPRFGMAGCAWATLIAYLCTFVGFALFLHRRVEVPLSWIFLSVTPVVASCCVLAATGNVWAAALTTLAASSVIAALKWDSVTAGVDILKRVVAR